MAKRGERLQRLNPPTSPLLLGDANFLANKNLSRHSSTQINTAILTTSRCKMVLGCRTFLTSQQRPRVGRRESPLLEEARQGTEHRHQGEGRGQAVLSDLATRCGSLQTIWNFCEHTLHRSRSSGPLNERLRHTPESMNGPDGIGRSRISVYFAEIC